MAWLSLRGSTLALLPFVGLSLGCDTKDDGSDDGEVADTDPADENLGDDAPAAGDDDEPSAGDPAEPGDPSGEPSGTPAPRPDAAELCDWDHWGGYACTTEDGQEGTNYCIVVDGEELYTPCSTIAPECEPGDGYDMGCVGEICAWDGEAFYRFSWSEPDCNTPLVMSFDGAPVEFAPASAAAFDLSTDGSCMSTDWPTAPWLALDRDGDGAIRSGSELFGSATPMAAGTAAAHGFAALAELDSNRDGKISAADERFGELVLWSDLDDDRVGTPAELRPLHETTVVSIDLGFASRAQCDRQGNCGRERAAFEYRTPAGTLALGEVVDVYLQCR